MSITIRPMTDADFDAAKRVILSVAASMFGPDDPDGFIAEWWNRMSDVEEWPRVYGPPRGTFLVALDGATVIGTGAIRPLDETTAELKRLWLLEAYQGQGIGYRLTEALLAFARGAGYRRVWLSTDVVQGRAIRFYERLGFQPIPPYADNGDTVFLGRPLDGS